MYKTANSILEGLHAMVHRNLRAYQYLATYSGLIKLKHALRRSAQSIRDMIIVNTDRHDLTAASVLLTHLISPESTPVIDPELAYQITIQNIEYLQKSGSFDAAYDAIEDLAEKLKAEDADIYQRIHTMVLKALLFNRVGKPQKGFTVAMRAANAAWQAKLLPALWEAWGTVANILGAMGEYDTERKILDAIIPQVRLRLVSHSQCTNSRYLGNCFRRSSALCATLRLAGGCLYGPCWKRSSQSTVDDFSRFQSGDLC
jgi:anaphase-promoting complex subunit 5